MGTRLITNLTEAESSLTSAERILAYSNLPGEGEDVPHHKERTHQEHAVDAVSTIYLRLLPCVCASACVLGSPLELLSLVIFLPCRPLCWLPPSSDGS